MTVSDLNTKLGFEIHCAQEEIGNEIKDVYIGDLLSWVMGRAKEGDVWLTIQGHLNIVAVAVLAGISCIVICEGAQPEADTLKKAEAEGIPVLTTPLNSYKAAVEIYKLVV